MPEAPWLSLYQAIPMLVKLSCWMENSAVHPATEYFGHGDMQGPEPFGCVMA